MLTPAERDTLVDELQKIVAEESSDKGSVANSGPPDVVRDAITRESNAKNSP